MIPNVWKPFVSILCHLVGDYWLQTDWMAMNKGKRTLNCLVHVLIYTACFLVLTTSWKALLFIGATHFLLDRFPIIIKKLIYWKNHFPTFNYPSYKFCDSTGYFDDSPYVSSKPDEETIKEYGKPRHKEITWWLYIISDNTLHLIFNFIALTYLT